VRLGVLLFFLISPPFFAIWQLDIRCSPPGFVAQKGLVVSFLYGSSLCVRIFSQTTFSPLRLV